VGRGGGVRHLNVALEAQVRHCDPRYRLCRPRL
jgi:hypothetical protein